MEQKHISLVLFHLIVGTITSLIFALIGLAVFFILGFKWVSGYLIVVGILFLNGSVASFFAGVAAKKYPRDLTLKIIGKRPGSYAGIFIGAAIGSYLGKTPGAIIGLIACYFVGRKIGEIVAGQIADRLDRYFIVEWPDISIQQLGATMKLKYITSIFFIFVPVVYMIIPILLYIFDLRMDPFSDVLPMLEIGLLIVSIVVISIVLIDKFKPILARFAKHRTDEWKNYQVKMYYLLVPSIIGLLLYFVGSSLFIVILFNLLSMFSLGILAFRQKYILLNLDTTA